MPHPNSVPGLRPRFKQAVALSCRGRRPARCPVRRKAPTSAALQARVDQARSQARTLASSLQMRTAELAAAQGRATAAGRRQAELEATLARGVARARALEARVTAAQERLARAQEQFRRTQRVLARRLVAIYKSDPPDLATVLLESDGFSDLLTRTAYLQEINQADDALVNRVERLRNQVRGALAARARDAGSGGGRGRAGGRGARRDRPHPGRGHPEGRNARTGAGRAAGLAGRPAVPCGGVDGAGPRAAGRRRHAG